MEGSGIEAHMLPLASASVLTEDGTATFGNFANSAGVGGEHSLLERTIEGYLAVGDLEVEQQLFPYERACALGTEH